MKASLQASITLAAGAALLGLCLPAAAATFTVLHSFTASDAGFFPTGDLVLDRQGDVIGTTALGSQAGTVFRYAPAGQTMTFIHNFAGGDGNNPQGSLVLAGDSIFGTTAYGGASNAGTIYRLDLSSLDLVTLHDFAGKADGANPYGGLTLHNGALFGVAPFAGAFKGGTLYVASPSAAPSYLPRFEPLHAFDKHHTGPDGPYGDVAVDAAGIVYGVTEAFDRKRTGTIYAYDTATGRFRILHEFTDKATGLFPFAGVTLFSNSLYGTTFNGGARGQGTLWTYDLTAGTFAVIHAFTGTADGQGPQARLAITRAGLLYGTASGGGAHGSGTVFTMDLRTGAFAVLHDFQSADGQDPLAGLVVGKDGTLYGTASIGGAGGLGTLFSIVP